MNYLVRTIFGKTWCGLNYNSFNDVLIIIGKILMPELKKMYFLFWIFMKQKNGHPIKPVNVFLYKNVCL